MSLLLIWLLFAVKIIEIAGDCGRPNIPTDIILIVGGKTVVPNSWPWQVAIFKYYWLLGYQQWCGGTVISNQWIMTAGHCVYGDQFPSKYRIKLGVQDQRRIDEIGEVVADVDSIYLHPNYDPATASYDVALIKLSQPVEYSHYISPICLPYQNESLPPAETNVIVTGWGLLESGGSPSSTLQEVVVPLVDMEKCEIVYPGMVRRSVMFCAGVGGKDSCNGDSGGPLVFYNTTVNRWEQLGIVSWGDQTCALADRPGVYSRVAAYIDWIQNLTTIEHAY